MSLLTKAVYNIRIKYLQYSILSKKQDILVLGAICENCASSKDLEWGSIAMEMLVKEKGLLLLLEKKLYTLQNKPKILVA